MQLQNKYQKVIDGLYAKIHADEEKAKKK